MCDGYRNAEKKECGLRKLPAGIYIVEKQPLGLKLNQAASINTCKRYVTAWSSEA